MYTKTKLFQIALNILLLQKEITNADEDLTKEAKVLRTVWEPALFSALAELDLDRTMETKVLELIVADPNDLWDFMYKFPANCARLRRIVSDSRKDDDSTAIPKATGTVSGQVVIFTDEEEASLEYIPTDIPLQSLNVHAGLCVAAKLAYLAAPLLIGKGALAIRKQIAADSLIYKFEAQQIDRQENMNVDSPSLLSPFVRARLE